MIDVDTNSNDAPRPSETHPWFGGAPTTEPRAQSWPTPSTERPSPVLGAIGAVLTLVGVAALAGAVAAVAEFSRDAIVSRVRGAK